MKSAPFNFQNYYNLGLLYPSLRKYDQAESTLEIALEHKPDSSAALSSLGVIYLRWQKLEKAEKVLKAAVELERENAENWYNLSCLQALKKNTAASKESLKKALSLDKELTMQLAAHEPVMSPLVNSLLQ